MMGMLINGRWEPNPTFATDTGGHFVRQDAGFRNWVTRDGSPGPSGTAASAPNRIAIISMCRSPARGRIAR